MDQRAHESQPLYQDLPQRQKSYAPKDRCAALLGRLREQCEAELRLYGEEDRYDKPSSYDGQVGANKNLVPGNGMQTNNNYGNITPMPTPTPKIPSNAIQAGLECHVTSTSMASEMETAWCTCNNSQVRSLYTGRDYSRVACPATFQFKNGATTPEDMDQYVLTQSSSGTTWKCQFTTQILGESDVRVSVIPDHAFEVYPIWIVLTGLDGNP